MSLIHNGEIYRRTYDNEIAAHPSDARNDGGSGIAAHLSDARNDGGSEIAAALRASQ